MSLVQMLDAPASFFENPLNWVFCSENWSKIADDFMLLIASTSGTSDIPVLLLIGLVLGSIGYLRSRR